MFKHNEEARDRKRFSIRLCIARVLIDVTNENAKDRVCCCFPWQDAVWLIRAFFMTKINETFMTIHSGQAEDETDFLVIE